MTSTIRPDLIASFQGDVITSRWSRRQREEPVHHCYEAQIEALRSNCRRVVACDAS